MTTFNFMDRHGGGPQPVPGAPPEPAPSRLFSDPKNLFLRERFLPPSENRGEGLSANELAREMSAAVGETIGPDLAAAVAKNFGARVDAQPRGLIVRLSRRAT